jgi:hypothetical protein
MLCLFLSSKKPALGDVPRGGTGLRHTPARAFDPYLDDGPPPAQVIQLYFDALPELEAAALSVRGPWSAEAMAVQRFLEASLERACTYLVAYEGPAQDEAAWLAEYLAHHPRLMAKLPGIRGLEVYTPVDWRCPASLSKVRHLQRNKVVFDSAEALTAALNSPVRSEMRKHYLRLPPFSGRVTHYAMTTTIL